MTTPSEAIMEKTSEAKAVPDVIEDTVAEIENLSKDAAFASIGKLNDSSNFNNFRLGGVLSSIQKNQWWQEQGHESFKSCIEDAYGMEYRKAMYLMGIYNNLVESEVPWSKVSDIGWTKLKELAAILTKENVDEWVEIAKDHTAIQLQARVREAKKGTLASSGSEPTSSDITTFSVKVHGDQKETIKDAVDKAKAEAETEFDGVALEAICISYLSGGKVAKVPSFKEAMATMEPEEVLQTFSAIWPDIDLKVTM